MILGITGISGAGKHTASEYLKQKGWVILDADKIAHLLYRPYTELWKAVVNEFGEKILNQDDTINRFKLSEIVFEVADPKKADKALLKLNKIAHPFVNRQIKDEIHRHFRRGSDIAVIGALWKEADLIDSCEKILLVKANPELRLKRVKKRDGISDSMIQMRIRNQTEPDKPDWTIENNGTKLELDKKMEKILEEMGRLEN